MAKDENAQAMMASVLKQTYKGAVSAGGTARDVAASAFKRELKSRDPGLAQAVEVGGFEYCRFK